MRIGRQGSADWLIVRTGKEGLYLSLRVARTRRFWLAFGPAYVNRAGLR
jgi:hypothetical protein